MKTVDMTQDSFIQGPIQGWNRDPVAMKSSDGSGGAETPRAFSLASAAAASGPEFGCCPPSLAEVYSEHHDFMWRSLRRLGIAAAEVEDAVHDAFLVVARRLTEFEGRSSLRTWLFAIAMRVAQSRRRDRQRETHHMARYESVAPRLVEDPWVRQETRGTLLQLLDALDEDQRAVFIMIELEGMTAPEIAESLGLKVPTVYSRLRLAREAMRRAVDLHLARSKETHHERDRARSAGHHPQRGRAGEGSREGEGARLGASCGGAAG